MPNKVTMKEHALNRFDNFIHGVYFDDLSICDKIVNYHAVGNQFEGVVGNLSNDTNSSIVDKTAKDSIEVSLNNNLPLYVDYFKQLSQCVNEYTNKYQFADANEPWAVIEQTNIKKYDPKGGYHRWHTERCSAIPPNSSRHLVFMTYLNDVIDEGETEFYYQKIKVKPQKGLTLIWPADWTFTHRGIPSMTQTKYIVTGWYSYIKNSQV
jgi:hypothetical protein